MTMTMIHSYDHPLLSSQDLDCFIIDNNGFILISERPQEVSKGLGTWTGDGPSIA